MGDHAKRPACLGRVLRGQLNRFYRRDTAFQFVSKEASWLQIEPAYILQGLWTSQITNNFLLDVRAGYNKEVFQLGYQHTVGPNDFTRQDLTLSTETGAAPFAFSNPAWVFKTAVGASWYKGSMAGTHNFKFGFEWGDSYNPYIYQINQGINAQYNNGAALDVIAYDTPFTEKTYFRDTSAYFQDAWTLKRRFTLNLGLRYEFQVVADNAASAVGWGFSFDAALERSLAKRGQSREVPGLDTGNHDVDLESRSKTTLGKSGWQGSC